MLAARRSLLWQERRALTANEVRPVNNLSTHPSWCRDHVDDICQGEAHSYVDSGACFTRELLVRLNRLAEPGEPVTLFITMAGREPGSGPWDALHPDADLSPAGAAWLGATLTMIAAQAGGPSYGALR